MRIGHALSRGLAWFAPAWLLLAAGVCQALGIGGASQPGKLWVVDASQSVTAGPTIAGNVAYFVTGRQHCLAFDLRREELLWVTELPARVRLRLAPAVGGDKVFVCLEDQLVALRRSDGRLAWRVEARSLSGLGDALWAHGDIVVTRTGGGFVVALRQSDGGLVWGALPSGGNWEDGVIACGKLVVMGCENKIEAFGLKTGRRMWSVEGDFVGSGRLVAAGEALVVDTCAGVACLDACSGELCWSDRGLAFDMNCLHGEALYTQQHSALSERELSERDIWLGEVTGEHRIDLGVVGNPYLRCLTIGHRLILPGWAQGRQLPSSCGLSAFDTRRKRLDWHLRLPFSCAELGGIDVWQDRIIVGSGRGLHAVDAAEGRLDSLASFGREVCVMQPAGERLFLGSVDGDVLMLDLADGKDIAVAHLANRPAAILPWNERLLVVTQGAGVHALRRRDLTPLWQRSFALLQDTVVLTGDVLVGCDRGGAAVALDPTAGTVRWRRRRSGACLGMIAAANDGLWMVGGEQIVLLDAISGETRRRIGLKEPHDLVSHQGDTLILWSAAGRFMGLDHRSGEEKWTFEQKIPAAPALALDGVLYFGDEADAVALETASGRVLWRAPLPGNARAEGGLIVSRPEAFANLVFFAIAGGRLEAIDRRTGQRRWHYNLLHGDEIAGFSPGKTAIVLSRRSRVHAIDLSKPEGLFHVVLPDGLGGPPVIRDDMALLPGIGGLAAYDLDGRQLWRLAIEGRTKLVGNEGKFLASDTGRLCRLDLQRGRFRWCTDLGNERVGRLLQHGNRLLVASTALKSSHRSRPVRPSLYSELHRLASDTGALLWSYGPVEPVSYPPLLDEKAAVAVWRTNAGSCLGVDERSGRLLWRVETDMRQGGHCHLTTEGVLVRSVDEAGIRWRMLAPRSSRPRWEIDFAGELKLLPESGIAEMQVGFRPVGCIELGAGDRVACPERGATENPPWSIWNWWLHERKAVRRNGIVYTPCYEGICARCIASGQELWSVPLKGIISGKLVLRGRRLYYATDAGEFGVIDVAAMKVRAGPAAGRPAAPGPGDR